MKLLLSFFVLALAGCIATPRVETPAADVSAPAGAVAPMPRPLGADDATRKTNELLAAVGANKLDGLKPMKMDGMEGMDHSKMPGMKSDGDMQGMDHSKMPGMSGKKGPMPADAAATAEEMKKTAAEMKKASDEMKAKSDALKKKGHPR